MTPPPSASRFALLRPRFAGALVLVGLVGALAPRPAHAQEAAAPAPSADAQAQAREALLQGVAFYKEKRVPEAYDAFRRAWELARTAENAANLAATELALRKPRDAAEHLHFAIAALTAQSVAGDDPRRERLEAQLAGAREQVVTLHVSTDVDGATVFVNGRPTEGAGRAWVVFAEPGRTHVMARAPGRVEASREVEGAAGAKHEIALQLGPAPVAPVVEAVPLAPATPPEEPEAASNGVSKPLLIVGIAAGSAALVAGITLFQSSLSAGSEADLLRDQLGPSGCQGSAASASADCQRLPELNDQEATFRTWAVVGFVGAGVILGATATYWLWPRDEQAAGVGSVRLSPRWGAAGTGFDLTGRF